MAQPPPDAGTTEVRTGPAPAVAVHQSRPSVVGRMAVRRALPRRGLRTVGPWCFADHFGPEQVTPTSGLDVGPHPHTGLHTVTWLVDGAVLHKDSLGSEQVIRPGQLNLMTSGHGVVHAEEAVDTYRGTLHGVQLWLAQPDATRHGPPAFEHHAELPRVRIGATELTVLVGGFAGAASAARHDAPAVGAEAVVRPGHSVWPVQTDHEHVLVVLDGDIAVGGSPVTAGAMAYLAPGHAELPVATRDTARVLLLGGVPFDEPLIMFWNFVARGRDEIDAAVRQWQAHDDERFVPVRSPLPRIASPTPMWAPAT